MDLFRRKARGQRRKEWIYLGERLKARGERLKAKGERSEARGERERKRV